MSLVFRARPPAVIVALLGCSALAALGFWQIQRGHEKAALIAQYDAAAHAAPRTLDAHALAPTEAAGAARASGHYLPERQVLLDNQVHGSVPGFEVWTPLRLADGGLLIVNRGWIPQPVPRLNLPPLPAPEGDVAVQGLWRALPEPALRLGAGNCAAGQAPSAVHFPVVLEYPTATELQCLYGEPVLAGELLLDRDAPGGYVRDWLAAPSEMPPSRHYGYAAQWFAFAATLFVLFIKFNLKQSLPGTPP